MRSTAAPRTNEETGKWGNILGLRIPKSFAAEAAFEAGSTVNIAIEGDSLVIRPVRRPRYSLDDLLG